MTTHSAVQANRWDARKQACLLSPKRISPGTDARSFASPQGNERSDTAALPAQKPQVYGYEFVATGEDLLDLLDPPKTVARANGPTATRERHI